MIHLSRFIIGVRHSRTFRLKTYAGELIDNLVKVAPSAFEKILESRSNDDFALSNLTGSLTAKFNRDDMLIEFQKQFDWAIRGFLEIDKDQVVKTAEQCLPIVTKTLSLEKSIQRIGCLFDFKIPSRDIEGSLDDFVFNKFIDYEVDGVKDSGALRLVYKQQVPGGGVIKKLNDFKNIIIKVEQSSGIDENGKEDKCLLVSVDIQHLFDPFQDSIKIKSYYDFAIEHLKKDVLPKFLAKGIRINLEETQS